MILEHDIFTFEVSRERNNLTIKMTDYVTEEGDTISLSEPADVTYVVSKQVYDEAEDLINDYEADH